MTFLCIAEVAVFISQSSLILKKYLEDERDEWKIIDFLLKNISLPYIILVKILELRLWNSMTWESHILSGPHFLLVQWT